MQLRMHEASSANPWQAVTSQYASHICVNIPEDGLLLAPEAYPALVRDMLHLKRGI